MLPLAFHTSSHPDSSVSQRQLLPIMYQASNVYFICGFAAIGELQPLPLHTNTILSYSS